MREVDIPGLASEEGQGIQRETHRDPQILLILVGLPGSGKTTFAEALIRDQVSAYPGKRKWIRASQDDAPSRRRQECEAIARHGLRDEYNVIVDRVGFDATQRSHFINIADQQTPRPRVYALYLSVSTASLEERLSLRTIHPTLSDPKLAMMVLRDMTRQLNIPTPEGGEGFDKIYTLDESLQPAEGYWSEEDLERVLSLIESRGEVETGPRKVIEAKPASLSGRGRGYDPARAGYRGRGGRGENHGHGYRGRGGFGYGSGGGNGSRQEDGRSWINDRDYRPYPQPGTAPHLGPPVGQSAYRPRPDTNRYGEPSRYIPPPPTSYYPTDHARPPN